MLASAIIFCVVGVSTALAVPVFQMSINLPGTRPYGIAVAQDGNLLVATQQAGTVFVLTPAGSLVRSFGSMSAAEIAVDAQGDVFVADHHGNQILKFNAAGQLLLSWPAANPVGVSLDQQDDLWVAEPYANALRHFSPDGQLLGSITGSYLSGPYGLEVAADGSLVVANYYAPSFIRISPTGGLLATYPTSGSMNHGVCFGPSGEMLVANAASGRVDAFALDGELLYSLMSPEGGAFDFDSVTDVAYSRGMTYIVDRNRSRVCVYTETHPTAARSLSWGVIKARFR